MHAVLRGAISSATIKCCRFHFRAKHGGGRSKLSGLVLITNTPEWMEPTEVEDCFTDDIMPDYPDDKNCNEFADYLLENYVTFDSKKESLLQTCGLVFPQKRRALIMAQSRFTLTLTNSASHPTFSYLTSCI